MAKVKIVILAAGKGKRLEALGLNVPKPLIPIHGKPMIRHLLDAVREAGVDNAPTLVIAPDNEQQFREVLADTGCQFVIQNEQLGTGHAAMTAREQFDGADHVMILYGDHPTVSATTIRRLAEEHEKSGGVLTLATVTFPDFEGWRQWFYNFGRIVRDGAGNISRIVELKDTTEEEKAITELNPAYMIFRRDWLCDHFDQLTTDNVQKEYYLTDLVELAVSEHQPIHSILIEDPIEAIGINTPEQLSAAEEALSQ
ncbi:MAG: NTP transferase domain-containing protein [Patescibacteria group bacterium]